jgi:hypothetical protein
MLQRSEKGRPKSSAKPATKKPGTKKPATKMSMVDRGGPLILTDGTSPKSLKLNKIEAKRARAEEKLRACSEPSHKCARCLWLVFGGGKSHDGCREARPDKTKKKN